MSGRSISVVICVYSGQRWDDLVAAVESVERQRLTPLETVVVVDHNRDLYERVRRSLPGVVAVENRESPGLSGARNSGVSAARGNIIAFLDDDAMAEVDWLMYLDHWFDIPSVAGVGGSVEPSWLRDRPRWFPEEFDWVVGCTYRGLPTESTHVRNLIGANMAFRRDLFDTVGTFRSGIGRTGTRPNGCEETEFCIRVFQHCPGSLFVYEPRARICHRVPPNRATWRYFVRRCYAEGRSKTTVTRLVGARAGLASERYYTLRTLPVGVARSLASVVVRPDLAGVARAAAIVVGLAVTATGFVVGHLTHRTASRSTPLGTKDLPRAITVPLVPPGSNHFGSDVVWRKGQRERVDGDD